MLTLLAQTIERTDMARLICSARSADCRAFDIPGDWLPGMRNVNHSSFGPDRSLLSGAGAENEESKGGSGGSCR